MNKTHAIPSVSAIFGYLFLVVILAPTAFAHPLKVGVVAPLTGQLGDYGVAMQRGISIATGAPSGNGRVAFVYEDTPYDAKSAVLAFQKLRLVDNVDLIYVWGIVFCRAVAPLADTFSMPTVGQCIDPESSKGKKFFIRFQSSSTNHMRLQVEKLHERGIKSTSLIVADNAYLVEMNRAFSNNLMGIDLNKTEIVPANETDFRGLIARLKREPSQAVGIFLLPGQISIFFKQAKSMNYRTLFFGTNFFESNSEIVAAQGSMAGAVFVGNKVSAEFESEMQRRFKATTQISFAALAHDFAALLDQLQGGKKLSGVDVFTTLLERTPGKGGAAGMYIRRDTLDEGTFFDFELIEKKVPEN